MLTSASGVVSVTGGKLTTYREMAEDTVDEVVGQLDDLPRAARSLPHPPRCRVARRRRRAPAGDQRPCTSPAATASEAARAARRSIARRPALAEPLVAGLPYLRAEAVYAARHEMARTVDDVLARRTRARLQARDASAAAAPDVAALMARRARAGPPPRRPARWRPTSR